MERATELYAPSSIATSSARSATRRTLSQVAMAWDSVSGEFGLSEAYLVRPPSFLGKGLSNDCRSKDALFFRGLRPLQAYRDRLHTNVGVRAQGRLPSRLGRARVLGSRHVRAFLVV